MGRLAKKLAGEDLQRFNEQKLELLVQFREICKKHNTEWFLDWGALLGAYRDNKFIDNDNDIDVGVMARSVTSEWMEDIKPIMVDHPKVKVNNVFHHDMGKGTCNELHQSVRIGKKLEDGTWLETAGGFPVFVDIYFYYPFQGGKMISRDILDMFGTYYMNFDSEYRTKEFILYGESFPIPEDVEKHLAFKYTEEWNIPKSESWGFSNIGRVKAGRYVKGYRSKYYRYNREDDTFIYNTYIK